MRKKIIGSTLKKYLWFLYAFHKLVLRKKSYLHLTGWVKSLKHGYPCESDGSVIPWMNYTVINILKDRLNNNLMLFEYGSGYSTLFYAKRVRQVISIEYDRAWLNLLKEKIPDNVSLMYREKDINSKYCRSVSELDQLFDVVIVDGRDRVNCVKQGIEKLSVAGVIILDDSNRKHYSEAIDYAKNKGFRVLDFEGLKPTGFGINKTSILYRDNNCLNI